MQSSKIKHNDCLQLPLAFKSVNHTSVKANTVLRACSNFGCLSLFFISKQLLISILLHKKLFKLLSREELFLAQNAP